MIFGLNVQSSQLTESKSPFVADSDPVQKTCLSFSANSAGVSNRFMPFCGGAEFKAPPSKTEHPVPGARVRAAIRVRNSNDTLTVSGSRPGIGLDLP